MQRRVSDIVMDILVEEDILDCFAVVGGGAMHLNNALALNHKINTSIIMSKLVQWLPMLMRD